MLILNGRQYGYLEIHFEVMDCLGYVLLVCLKAEEQVDTCLVRRLYVLKESEKLREYWCSLLVSCVEKMEGKQY